MVLRGTTATGMMHRKRRKQEICKRSATVLVCPGCALPREPVVTSDVVRLLVIKL